MALTQALVRGSSRRLRICCIRSLSTPGIAVPPRLWSPGSLSPHQLGAFHGEIGPNCNRSDLEILRGRLRRLLRRVTDGVVGPYPSIIAASTPPHSLLTSDRCSQRRVAAPPSRFGTPRSYLMLARPPGIHMLRQFSTCGRSSSRGELKHIGMVGSRQDSGRPWLPASRRSVGPQCVRGPPQFYGTVSNEARVPIGAGTALLFVLCERSNGDTTRPASSIALAA